MSSENSFQVNPEKSIYTDSYGVTVFKCHIPFHLLHKEPICIQPGNEHFLQQTEHVSFFEPQVFTSHRRTETDKYFVTYRKANEYELHKISSNIISNEYITDRVINTLLYYQYTKLYMSKRSGCIPFPKQ